MIPKLWLRFVAFLTLCLGTAGLTLTSLATVPYDGQWSVSTARDGHVEQTAGSYDDADVRTAREENISMVGEHPLFTKFSQFLAAEGTTAATTRFIATENGIVDVTDLIGVIVFAGLAS